MWKIPLAGQLRPPAHFGFLAGIREGLVLDLILRLGAAAAFPRMVPSMLFTLSGFLLAVNKCV